MSGNAEDAEVNKLDVALAVMWLTLWQGRQTLNKEHKCDEVYKREM